MDKDSCVDSHLAVGAKKTWGCGGWVIKKGLHFKSYPLSQRLDNRKEPTKWRSEVGCSWQTKAQAKVLGQEWAGPPGGTVDMELSESKSWIWDWQIGWYLETSGRSRWCMLGVTGGQSHLSVDSMFEMFVLHLRSLPTVALTSSICSANLPL